jgi:very-short-patch-repair endonuclease
MKLTPDGFFLGIIKSILMSPLFWAAVLLLIVVSLLPILLKRQSGNKEEETTEADDELAKHYVKRPFLMSKAEHEFFKVLKEAVQDKYYIVPQVQLSKLVDVNKYEKKQQTYRNKIDRKSVDFVLFEKEYFTPHLVVELDDSSHLLPEREDRDGFVNAVLGKAGIKIVHIKTAYSYNPKDIASEILV